MRISLGSWAFSFGPYADHPVPWETVASRLAEAGYDGIELCGFSPHITLDRYPTTASRKSVTRRLADLDLGISGYSSDFTAVNPTVPGNKGRYLDLFRRNIELCADLGSPLIRIDTVSAPGSLEEADYAAAMDRVAEIWHEAAAIALPAGVRVIWEFEPGFVFNQPSEALALHQKVGHENFKLLLDVSHAYMCAVVGARQHGERQVLKGGIAALIRMLEGRIGHVHIIDSDGTLYGDETSTHRPFGEGKIDWKSLTPHLLAIPGIEWWCVDHSFWDGSWELIEPSLSFVRGLLAEHGGTQKERDVK